MPLDTLEIKFALLRRAGTLRKAAADMSNDEYRFNSDQLSKVIRGERGNNIIRVRIAKYINKPVDEVFSNSH